MAEDELEDQNELNEDEYNAITFADKSYLGWAVWHQQVYVYIVFALYDY